MRNEQVLGTLPTVTSSDFLPLTLLDPEGNTLFTFLYAPETKEFSRTIEWAPSGTHSSSIQDLQYVRTTGKTLRMPGLLMESHGDGRSLKPLLTDLQKFITADPENGRYSPFIVYLAYGSDLFGPAVFAEEFSWVETKWVGDGSPAEVRIDITLREIPNLGIAPPPAPETDQTVAAASNLEATLDSLINNGSLLEQALNRARQDLAAPSTPTQTISLTRRQRGDAISSAEQWLSQNITSLSSFIQDDYYTQSYSLSAETGGVVSFLNSRNSNLGSLGIYDGQTFNPNKEL